MGLRQYFAGDYSKKVYLHIQQNYPYWNRSGGRDHIWVRHLLFKFSLKFKFSFYGHSFVCTWGSYYELSCWTIDVNYFIVSTSLKKSLVHFCHDSVCWAYQFFPWDEGACAAPKEIWNSMMLTHWGNTNAKHKTSTTAYFADNWDPIPPEWRGHHPCYDPAKDLVLPAWKFPDPYPISQKFASR